MELLTKPEAVSLTKKLKSKTGELARLLQRAHEGRVWEPLGFKSFSEWLAENFTWTRSRAYRLINMAVLTDAITDRVKLRDGFMLTDSQTRTILKEGREEFISDLEQEADPEDPVGNENKLKTLVANTQEDQSQTSNNHVQLDRGDRKKVSGGTPRRVKTCISLQTQARAFPSPLALADDQAREEGVAVLASAVSSIVDRLQELNELYDEHFDAWNSKLVERMNAGDPLPIAQPRAEAFIARIMKSEQEAGLTRPDNDPSKVNPAVSTEQELPA